MIGWDLDLTLKCESARPHDCYRFFGGYPQFFRWPSRLPQNYRFLTWSSMPIHDGKQPAWFQNIVHGACKAWLVRYPVECVCEKHLVDAIADHVCKVVSICFNQHAVGQAAFRQPDDDQDGLIRFMYGSALLATKAYRDALAELETAVELNPCLAVSYCGLGDSLAYEGAHHRSDSPFSKSNRAQPV